MKSSSAIGAPQGGEPKADSLGTVHLLLAVAYDFAKDGPALLNFLDHVGFDVVSVSTAAELEQALPAFYRVKKGVYDVARLERDLMTWHPVAAAVEAARKEQNASRDGGLS